jgi:RNA polymerase sigma-70 factor (ECF subfamily)
MESSELDRQLVGRIREGDTEAWQELVDRFEGRLLAYLRSRLQDASIAEDVLQETLLGFLRALPAYDDSAPLEPWLFSIAAHKLIDEQRRRGRRPIFALPGTAAGEGAILVGPGRRASSLYLSREGDRAESDLIGSVLQQFVEECHRREDWQRLKCIELLIVRGWTNQQVAVQLNLTEKQVANHKYYVVEKLRRAARESAQKLRLPPELDDSQFRS